MKVFQVSTGKKEQSLGPVEWSWTRAAGRTPDTCYWKVQGVLSSFREQCNKEAVEKSGFHPSCQFAVPSNTYCKKFQILIAESYLPIFT